MRRQAAWLASLVVWCVVNRLSWFASRIRGLEPRSATPAASSILLAKADGSIDRGWTPSAAWTDVENTFAANVTLSSAGSSSSAPRTLSLTALPGEFSRFNVAGSSNGMQCGNGQRTQIYSWLQIDLIGDRQTQAPAFVAGGSSDNVSVRIASSRAVSRPLVIQGASSQAANLNEFWNSAGTVLAAISNTGLFLLPAGSASAPSWSWIGDPNTGFFNSGLNDTIEMTTGGTRRAYLNSGGLTLTTEDAQGAFRHSTPAGGFGFRIQNTGTGGADYRIGVSANSWAVSGGRFLITPDTSSTGAVFVLWNGKCGVGAGNYSPAATFHSIGSTILGAATSAVADADLGNGQINFYLDESGHNLKIKAKYSSGTIRTATIALVV